MFWRTPIGSCAKKVFPCSFLWSGMALTPRRLPKQLPEAFFTGYLTGKELATAYASADIFVFPSTTDTFGNVIIEAQASGLPVIVSDSGGPKSWWKTKPRVLSPNRMTLTILRALSARSRLILHCGSIWATPLVKASSTGAGQTRSESFGRSRTSRDICLVASREKSRVVAHESSRPEGNHTNTRGFTDSSRPCER